MNVQAVIDACSSPVYKQWEGTHPNATWEEQQYVIDLLQTSAFKQWLQTHPSGTIDGYLAYRQSSQYQLDGAELYIENLKSNISELRYEIEEKDSEIDSLQSINIGLGISVGILFLISVVLAIIVFRRKR